MGSRRQLSPRKINLLGLIWIERLLPDLGSLAWKSRISRLALDGLSRELRIWSLLRILAGRILAVRILGLRILTLRILSLRILGLLIRVVLDYRLLRASARNAVARPASRHI